MLKVLHAGNLLCAAVFIIRAGFRSPFSSLPNRVLVAGGKTKTIQTQQRDFRKKTHRFLISNVFFSVELLVLLASLEFDLILAAPCKAMQNTPNEQGTVEGRSQPVPATPASLRSSTPME